MKYFLDFNKYQKFFKNSLVIFFKSLLFKFVVARLHMALKFLIIKTSMFSIVCFRAMLRNQTEEFHCLFPHFYLNDARKQECDE